ncbi:MAG: hypothetical protein HGB02_03765 [Chlorobiaceae bacterium]|nr:hypothetical protein [Chlorobiaceae bacterium]
MSPKHTITKDVKVGIYDNCEYVARVYADKITVKSPYIKWVGNTGGYAEKKEVIKNQSVVDVVLSCLSDDAEDTAWERIGEYLSDSYLMPKY